MFLHNKNNNPQRVVLLALQGRVDASISHLTMIDAMYYTYQYDHVRIARYHAKLIAQFWRFHYV